VIEQTRADFAAEGRTYRPQPGEEVIERMVREFERPGRAGGAGFYDYPAGAAKALWPGLKRHFEKRGAAWDLDELMDRMLYRQAIEAARCVEENVITSIADANIGSIFGIGFPAWTGGALQFIDSTGLPAFVARAGQLAERHGPRFALPTIVRDKAARAEPFG